MKKYKKVIRESRDEIIRHVDTYSRELNGLRRDITALSTKQQEIIDFIRNQSNRENINEAVQSNLNQLSTFMSGVSKNISIANDEIRKIKEILKKKEEE